MRALIAALGIACLATAASAGPGNFQNAVPVASSTAPESCHTVLPPTGMNGLTLYAATANNTTASVGWAMVFDAAVAPSNGAVTPQLYWQVAGNTSTSSVNGPWATMRLNNGFVICFSSTGPFTLTLTTSSFSWQVGQ